MTSTAKLPEIQDNRIITNPELIKYLKKINTEVSDQLGEGFSFCSDSVFAIIPKIPNHIYIYTLLQYRQTLHGEICRKMKLREVYSKEKVFEICKNNNPNFSLKYLEAKLYIKKNDTRRNIYDSTEALIKRLEPTDFRLQDGDFVYNYLMKGADPLSQYLVIERRVGSLIQQTIVDNHESIPTLVQMNTIDPAEEEENFFVALWRYFFPCCFKKPSVFEQENQYEQIENSE